MTDIPNFKLYKNININKGSVKQLHRINKELQQLVYYDTLTGVYNRKPFVDMLETNILKAKKIRKKIALLFIDLDNFKDVNDIYGHKVGDFVLEKVAKIIGENIRRSDFVGRIGGDEFVVALYDIKSFDNAYKIAKKINNIFLEKIIIKSHPFSISISIGISVYPDDAETAEELLLNSDIAMYKAKNEKTKNLLKFSDKLKEQNNFAFELNSALERDHYKVYHQPIVNRELKTCFVESLLRYESISNVTILPSEFILILEKNKSIIDVGEWVMKHSCNLLNQLVIDKAFEDIVVSINISDIQLNDSNFVKRYNSIIKESDINPCNIMIEFSEKSKRDSIENIVKSLNKLKENGVGLVALDDFGIGYTSLINLIHFPIDVVKIDKYFVDRICSLKYEKLVINMISIIKEFGYKVVVEGVETKKQFELLKTLGCDYYQGYYIAKPQKDIIQYLNL
jgi:diguanylate cyclase (GGDEF)-like protein